MRWSDRKAARFTLRLDWPTGRPHGAALTRILIADSLEDAKLEAAILYACLDADALPPSYRIVKGARRIVYRYPESPSAARHAA